MTASRATISPSRVTAERMRISAFSRKRQVSISSSRELTRPMPESACSWHRYFRLDRLGKWDGPASASLQPQTVEQHADDDDGAKHDHLHVTVDTGEIHA